MQCLLGTILLEPNRHQPGKVPTFAVSQWLGRIAAAGFDGIELWENHAALATPAEVEAIAAGPVRVAVFNSYCGFTDAERPQRVRCIELVNALGAGAVKWNLGSKTEDEAEMVRNARAFAEALPRSVRLLCECHPGTIAEKPEDAARLLAAVGDATRVQAIVHSAIGPEKLAQWFDALGERITHVHAVLGGRLAGDDPLAGLRYLRDREFSGSVTLEFTREMNTPGETVERNLQHAIDDRQTLLSLWSQGN